MSVGFVTAPNCFWVETRPSLTKYLAREKISLMSKMNGRLLMQHLIPGKDSCSWRKRNTIPILPPTHTTWHGTCPNANVTFNHNAEGFEEKPYFPGA